MPSHHHLSSCSVTFFRQPRPPGWGSEGQLLYHGSRSSLTGMLVMETLQLKYSGLVGSAIPRPSTSRQVIGGSLELPPPPPYAVVSALMLPRLFWFCWYHV